MPLCDCRCTLVESRISLTTFSEIVQTKNCIFNSVYSSEFLFDDAIFSLHYNRLEPLASISLHYNKLTSIRKDDRSLRLRNLKRSGRILTFENHVRHLGAGLPEIPQIGESNLVILCK